MNPYVHHVPGRLRVRVPCVKGNVAEASSLERCIRAQKGVKDVQTSPVTGSVLVHYDPATACVPALSKIMLCSVADQPLRTSVPKNLQKEISQRIATRVAVTVAGHVMEIAVERAAVALLAALS